MVFSLTGADFLLECSCHRWKAGIFVGSPPETKTRYLGQLLQLFLRSLNLYDEVEFLFNYYNMPLTREQKEELVKQMTEKMKEAKSVVFAEYKGLTVEDMDTLRAKMREQGVSFQVAKKTLMRLAAKEARYEEIPDEVIEGAVGVAFGMEDEVAAAKLLHNFAKDNDNLKLRGALFEGKVLGKDKTKELALIPGKEELLAKFVYLLKAPVQGFHGVLHNTVGGFVRVLNAVKEKKEQEGAA